MGYYKQRIGKKRKRGEIQALNVEGRKIMDQQTTVLLKLLMSILLLLQKMLKDKAKIML
jgi:hypothetical protein